MELDDAVRPGMYVRDQMVVMLAERLSPLQITGGDEAQRTQDIFGFREL